MSPAAGKASPVPPEALCVAGPGEKVLRDFQVLVRKVGGRPEVLLIGETLDGQDIHGMMADFVNDVFSSTCQPVHPGDLLKEPPSPSACTLGGQQCQLLFFLCRASCMAAKQPELQKVLKELRKYVQKAPCAVVGVIMDAKPSEAEAARSQLLRLLRGVFTHQGGPHRKEKPGPGAKGMLENVEVEAEIYIPGQPRGKFAIMRAACRASEALSKPRGSRLFKIFKIFLFLTIIVALAAAAWYIIQEGIDVPSFIKEHLSQF